MPTEQRVTFCRICEALCGLTATVEDGRLVALHPDPEHPVSRGYACPKEIAMTEVQNDPDRVLHPLRRSAGGGFERVSWPAALEDIGRRLRAVRERYGPSAIAWYMGNPAAFGYAHAVWSRGFMDALGSPSYYTAGSQDVNNRFAASALLYGSPLLVPIPDLARTRFLLMVGANPLVSQGSLLTAPRIRDVLRRIVRRGGRVVVVDPRRSETARVFEHISINPDADAWLLLSMLHVIFDEGLEDREARAPAPSRWGPRGPGCQPRRSERGPALPREWRSPGPAARLEGCRARPGSRRFASAGAHRARRFGPRSPRAGTWRRLRSGSRLPSPTGRSRRRSVCRSAPAKAAGRSLRSRKVVVGKM